MVGCVIDKTVVGKHDAFCTSGGRTKGIDVTFGKSSIAFLGQSPFIISKIIAADTFTGCIRFQPAACPAERCRLSFGNEVSGKMPEQVNIERDIFF